MKKSHKRFNTILLGAASAMDLFGVLAKKRKNRIFISDRAAINNDWAAIGEDF